MAHALDTDLDKLGQLLSLAGDPGVHDALERASQAGSDVADDLQRLITRLRTYEADLDELVALVQPEEDVRGAPASRSAAKPAKRRGVAAKAAAPAKPPKQAARTASPPAKRQRSAPTQNSPRSAGRSARADGATLASSAASTEPAPARRGARSAPAGGGGGPVRLPRGYETPAPKPQRPPRGWATEPEMCKPEAESLLDRSSLPDPDWLPELTLPPSPVAHEEGEPLDLGDRPDLRPRVNPVPPATARPTRAAPPELGLGPPRGAPPMLPGIGASPGLGAPPRGPRRSDLGPPPDLDRWSNPTRAPAAPSRDADDKPGRAPKGLRRITPHRER